MYKEEYRYCGNELKPVHIVAFTRWARWTKDEKRKLAENYPQKQMKELASMFGRPVKSIESQLNKLGIYKYPNWSDNDIDYLKQNFSRLSTEQLSVILKKSENAIRIKKSRLCLK